MINLAKKIEERLPAELVSFTHLAGATAHSQGQNLYLVGGVVRDLLLGEANFDLDLVLEGDAIELAHHLVLLKQARIKTHSRFNTAKLQWDNWSVDIATARSEIYVRPGALPKVKPGILRDDLFRRDFTINAMAVHLSPDHYGELIDLYGGLADLEKRLIRVLHDNSFIDDATRIWRAIRYEQRLDFQIETATLVLVTQDVPYLDTISGDRIRHELELIFREKQPEKAIHRAGELGVLAQIQPSLRPDGWLAEKFTRARQMSTPHPPSFALYLALLSYQLNQQEAQQLAARLKLPASAARGLEDTIALRDKANPATQLSISHSNLYDILAKYSLLAITANLLATTDETFRQRLRLFLDELRLIKVALTGDDLKRLGVLNGPQIGEMLRALHRAKLDGRVSTRGAEETLVRSWLTNGIDSGC